VNTRKNLHRARVAKSMDLSRVSALTALSPNIVRRIDEGRFEDLPGGLYARSYVRAFAEAVGVKPEEALRDVEPLLPAAPDPFPTLREKAGPSPAAWLAAELRRLATLIATRFPATAVVVESDRNRPALRRGIASVLDALVLVGIGVTTATLTAWLCGVGVIVLLEEAGLALAAMLVVPVALYFFLFQGIGGRTPGATACGLPTREEPRELRLEIIATRLFRAH
jgi:hypothetical protein